MEGVRREPRVALGASPPANPAPTPAAAPVEESPLLPRLKWKANRLGDAVPYGNHGPWGLYREGDKEMSMKISEGKITPSEASAQLADAGVKISADTLAKRAKKAPGASPIKGGAKLLIPELVQQKVYEEIVFFRKHDIPTTRSMIKAMILSMLSDDDQERLFPKGVTNETYYRFLDSKDLNTEDTKPLDSDRDLWLTSKVRFHGRLCPRLPRSLVLA